MNTEQTLQATEAKLEQMWDKIQELKHVDPFAAAIQYAKYKKIASELPPPVPADEVQLSFSSLKLD